MNTPPRPQHQPGESPDGQSGTQPDAGTRAPDAAAGPAQPAGAAGPAQPAGADERLSADEFIAARLDPSGRPELLPDGLFEHMRADPLHAPEYLALAAVERFGPDAQEWIAEFRTRFPHVTDEHLAAVTRKRFVRLSSYSGAVAGVAGGVGAVLDFGVLAWNQAQMVIYLATIFGQDPTSRDRAAELLMLQNVHKVMATAQTALDVAARRKDPTDLLKHSGTVAESGGSLTTLAVTLAKMVGMRLARKGLMKLIPFASVPLGAIANASSTGDLADRAIAMYRYRRQSPPQLPPA
jgi:uncharacterized protein (DUF697 family)